MLRGPLPSINARTGVCYRQQATPSFAADIIRTGKDHPKVRSTKGLESRCDWLFTVLGHWTNIHSDMTQEPGKGTHVHELCLMDGTRSIFRAKICIGMHKHMSTQKLEVGCTIYVKDYFLLWFASKKQHAWNWVMLIRDFGKHSDVPNDYTKLKEEQPKALQRSVNWEWFDQKMVEKAMKESMVVFSQFMHTRTNSYWSFMPEREIRCGDFIVDNDERLEWVSSTRKRKLMNDILHCDCREQLGLEKCILTSVPLDNVDTNDVMEMCLGGEKRTWCSLSREEKILFVTRYYCGNYFCLKWGGYITPKCFAKKVKNHCH